MKKITFLLVLLVTSLGFSQTNILVNGDFETGAVSPWTGNAANVVDDGSTTNFVNEANVAMAANPWDANLSQAVVLEAGKTYELSYTAYTDATTATRTMIAGIGRNEPDFDSRTSQPPLTATPTTFTYQYIANFANPANSRVLFDMGAQQGFVFIDNVSLIEVVDTAPPTGFTASLGTVTAFSVELLLNATDDSGSVTYDINVNAGAITLQHTAVSGATTYTVTGLSPETAYTFEVSASDAAGNNAINNPLTVLATTPADSSTACAGQTADYAYTFETLANGTDVKVTIELLNTVNGLVAQFFNDGNGNQTPILVSGQLYEYTFLGLTDGAVMPFTAGFAWEAGGTLQVSRSYTVGDNCSTASNDEFNLAAVNVSPNPTNSVWEVNASVNIDTINVFDILGKRVISLSPNSQQASIDASNLRTGIYLVQFSSNGATKTLKLVRN